MDRKLTQILVIHPGALGDTMLALPVLAALKEQYHPATLCLIGHPLLREVLPGRSAVDTMKSIEGREYREILEGHETMSSTSTAFFQQFDVAVVWTADQDGRLHDSLSRSGIPTVMVQSPRLGEESSRHATDRFKDTVAHLLTDRSTSKACGSVPPLCKGRPRAEEVVLATFGLGGCNGGVEAQRATEYLRATEEDRKAAAIWLADHAIDPIEAPLVAVHPGSGSPTKCWPPEQFAEVVIGLMQDGIQVILIEGPADTRLVHALQEKLPEKLPRLHDASLSLVLGVLSCCSAFVGNDSGVTQMAAALELPTIAVFGPTDPALWGFRCTSLTGLRGDSCRCPTREMQRACESRSCLSIPPETVLNALRERLPGVSLSLATDPSLC